MEAEAQPFVKHLNLAQVDDFFPSHVPFCAFQGIYQPTPDTSTDSQRLVTVITNGKDSVYKTGVDNCGTVPASLATFLALDKIMGTWKASNPADTTSHGVILINAGTCGGFKRKGVGIGDVVILTGVAFHDRRIPIPQFDLYGKGVLACHGLPQDWLDLHGYKSGTITTGDSLDTNEIDDACMMANDATVKDMEAAAIAWTCALHKVPMVGVKIVTDIVDGGRPTQDEFMENLHTASVRLQEALPTVLHHVYERSFEDFIENSAKER
jgi:5'-methylthioadenosine nucleosidase